MRLGLIAVARITESAMVEPSRVVPGVELAAIAARDPARGARAAERWRIPHVHPNYAALLDDNSIDAVYVATPASHHRQPVMAALAAGKHVLCEKPLAANASEASEMVACAAESGLILMEAFHWRYHPYVTQIRGVLDSGMLGAITQVTAVANLPGHFFDEGDIRWDLSLGGGCLMDVGCYPLHWLRWLTGDEPTVVEAHAVCRTPEVDESFSARLTWASGTFGSIESSMVHPQPEPEVYFRAVGEHGVLTAYNPVLPQLGATLVVDRNEGQLRWDVDRSSTYEHQLRSFVAAVTTGTPPPTSGADSVANMRLIDACYRAAGLSPRPSLPADL